MINKKLNILQIINLPWKSGILEYGLTLSKALKDRGHKVIIAGLENSPLREDAKENNIRLETIGGINSLNPVRVFNAVSRLKEIIRKEKINVIDAHRAEGQSLGFVANKLSGDPAVLIRTRGDQRPAKNNVFNRYLYNDLTDKIIVASVMAKQNHFCGFDIGNKIEVIRPAVDLQRFNTEVPGGPFRRAYGIKEDECLIGIVGRLDPVKGHRYFIEAASFLKDDFKKTKYIIIGQEENIKIEQLKEIVDNSGLAGRVIFTDFYKNVETAIAGIDIGVVASTGSEAVSRVTLEMMACAKPVVATRVGSIPEMILDGETGLLCDPADSRNMAENIRKLILAPGMMKEMGGKGRMRAKELFSIENLVLRTERIYYEALEKKWKK